MSALLSQLMRFSSGAKAWHSRPFSVKVHKVVWSVATDGFLLFGVKGTGAAPGTDLPKDRLTELLGSPHRDPVDISVADLKAWAGEVPAKQIPPGDVAYEHQGVLLGCAVDRRKLAYLLSMMPLTLVRVWAVEPRKLIGLEGGNGLWRAFISGLGGDIEGDEPVFQVTRRASQGVTAFEVAEEVGSE